MSGSNHAILVVVDMQKDFLDGALENPMAIAVLPRVRERIRVARERGEEVVFTRDTHGADYLSTQEGKRLPVPHCLAGSEGWQLAAGLAEPTDRIFDKPAFGSLELARYIFSVGADAVELIGVCTDICVISNAFLLKAFCPEARICVRADCCAGITSERHATALEAMRACQIDIVD